MFKRKDISSSYFNNNNPNSSDNNNNKGDRNRPLNSGRKTTLSPAGGNSDSSGLAGNNRHNCGLAKKDLNKSYLR